MSSIDTLPLSTLHGLLQPFLMGHERLHYADIAGTLQQHRKCIALQLILTPGWIHLQAAQRAAQSGKGDAKAVAAAGSSLGLMQEVSNEEASTSEHTPQQQQQGMARKPRARKRSKRK